MAGPLTGPFNGLSTIDDRSIAGFNRTQILGPGARTFIAPEDNIYTFRAWGAGGGGAGVGSGGTPSSGGSGAFARKTVRLSKGQVVSMTIGAGRANNFSSGTSSGSSGETTTLSFPDGTTVTCTGGAGGSGARSAEGGTATGGDINRSGSAGGDADNNIPPVPGDTGGAVGAGSRNGWGGAGAPGDVDFPGGDGGAGFSGSAGQITAGGGRAPGGGGGAQRNSGGTTGLTATSGGDGLVIVTFLGKRKP